MNKCKLYAIKYRENGKYFCPDILRGYAATEHEFRQKMRQKIESLYAANTPYEIIVIENQIVSSNHN